MSEEDYGVFGKRRKGRVNQGTTRRKIAQTKTHVGKPEFKVPSGLTQNWAYSERKTKPAIAKGKVQRMKQ